jgi:hypothetical protein
MRPTFGYLIAITWAAQMLALAYVIVFETSKASIVIEAMESLGTIWAVGLSVLGIYVYKRSEDKKITEKYSPIDRDLQTYEAKKVRSNDVQRTLND